MHWPLTHREKYVTRQEYNELKERFEQLSQFVHNMARSGLSPGSFMASMGPPSVGPSSVQEPHPSYGHGYSTMQAPPHDYSPHMNGPSPVMTTLPHPPYSRPEDSHPPHRTAGPSSLLNPSLHDTSGLKERRPSRPKSPPISGAPSTRRSPYPSRSHPLPSIASTLTPIVEPKNLHTQALRLGERLRQEVSPLQGSAIMFTPAPLRIPFLRASRMLSGILSMRHVHLLPTLLNRQFRTTPTA